MAGLNAIVFGSAAGGGLPQWNCRCPVCDLAWRGDRRVRPRTQAGLGVAGGDGRWALINASPDLRQQIERTPALHPRGGARGSPIEAVVLTGAEIDQIAGLLSLRESSPFTHYATPATRGAIAANPMLDALRTMERRRVSLGEPFPLSAALSAELFAVPGKAPLYLEGERPALVAETETTCGIEIRCASARLVYVPGAAAVTPAMLERFHARGRAAVRRYGRDQDTAHLYAHQQHQSHSCGRLAGASRGGSGRLRDRGGRHGDHDVRLLSPDELKSALREIGARRYHNLHPFHRMLHGGQCSKGR